MKINKSSEIAIRSDMSVKDAGQALMTLSGKGMPVTRLALQDGQFVLYLRKPGIKDRLKMALMPSQMRKEARSLIKFALENIAGNGNVSKDDLRLASINGSIEKSSDRLLEKSFLLQFPSMGDGINF